MVGGNVIILYVFDRKPAANHVLANKTVADLLAYTVQIRRAYAPSCVDVPV